MRKPWPTLIRRSAFGSEIAAIAASRWVASSLSSPRSNSLNPSSPVSRLRSAFCRLSWKVRPIAIASPTDFIEVVSRSSAPGNFSKVKRGILVTT